MTRILTLLSLLLALAACGGGGGTPAPTTNWQPGVFMPSSSFINRCQNPRSGPDPTNGNQPYPDIGGRTLDENNFLRSFSDEVYLWYDEITDRDPAGFNSPLDYFPLLKTFETLPSGREKDPDSFHYAVDSLEWFNQTQGGVSFGYGAELAIISGTPPRRAIVAYTEPNSPATDPAVNIQRGAELLAVDGVDFVNDNTQAGLNVILEGLYPTAENVPHTFTIRDFGAASSRQVTMTSTTITNAMVQETQVFDTAAGDKVGYLVFNFFRAPAEEELIDAINQLIADAAPDPVDDLIIDLRYNGGGFGIIASQLGYMIAGPARTTNRTFDLLQFNDKHPTTNPITMQPISPDGFLASTTGFFTLPGGQPLPTLNLPRVFVLTGFNTASASELLMNGLRGIDVQVIQVGNATRGKPYGFYETPNCGTSYFTVQFRSVNEKNWGDFAEGFIPSAVDDDMANVLGCVVSDDYSKRLGDPGEDRLEVALAYQAGQACITPAASARDLLMKPTRGAGERDGTVHRTPFDSNLIMLRPPDAN